MAVLEEAFLRLVAGLEGDDVEKVWHLAQGLRPAPAGSGINRQREGPRTQGSGQEAESEHDHF